MSQTILDDGINVLGSTWANPVEVVPPVILTPTDGASVTAPVTFSGTGTPGASLIVQSLVGEEWATVMTATVGADGTWTNSGSMIEGAKTVRVHDSTNSLDSDQITITVTSAAPLAARTETVYDPSQYTVAEVQAYLAEHPDQTETVLAAERAGKNRATLVNTEEN